jgi:hypothetical protein
MKANFTPGPWRFELSTSFDIYAANGDLIGDTIDCGDEDEANAQLIAAAPDLLSALETLVRRIERENLHTTRGIAIGPARAAIAAAQGGDK